MLKKSGGAGAKPAHDQEVVAADDGPAVEAAIGAAGAEVSDAGNPWYILTAQAISRVSSSVQKELIGNKLMPYFIEWCSTDSPRTKGVSYLDCAYRYDHGSENVSFLQTRSPTQNIYLGFLSKLLAGVDPVLAAVKERLQRTFEQTFWAIPQAFIFGQACQDRNHALHAIL